MEECGEEIQPTLDVAALSGWGVDCEFMPLNSKQVYTQENHTGFNTSRWTKLRLLS